MYLNKDDIQKAGRSRHGVITSLTIIMDLNNKLIPYVSLTCFSPSIDVVIRKKEEKSFFFKFCTLHVFCFEDLFLKRKGKFTFLHFYIFSLYSQNQRKKRGLGIYIFTLFTGCKLRKSYTYIFYIVQFWVVPFFLHFYNFLKETNVSDFKFKSLDYYSRLHISVYHILLQKNMLQFQ